MQFGPLEAGTRSPADQFISLTLEEYETIRIIDYLDRTQEECAPRSDGRVRDHGAGCVSVRAEEDGLHAGGREALFQSGGNYEVCPRAGGCAKRLRKRLPPAAGAWATGGISRMEDGIMKIAVTYENGSVFQHFGHSEQFRFIRQKKEQSYPRRSWGNGNGHGAGGFLKEMGVETLICGGIGGGAKCTGRGRNQLYPG